MKKRKLLSIILAASLVLVFMTGCGRGQQDGVFIARAAVSNPPPHPFVLGIEILADLLYERSDGRIRVDVFHSGQLGSDRDIVEGIQFNTIQFGFITSAPLSGFTDAYMIFDLPFLFENIEEARAFTDSEFGLRILASLENDGIIGLGFGENGMRHITNSRRPIHTPADLSGIVIRTMENPMHMDAFRVMGADPTPMAFGELFTALQQGAIDAQENPFVVIHTSRFFEVQRYLSVTNHLYSPAPLLMSRIFYESLPTDLRQIVREVGLEASHLQRAVVDEQSAIVLTELEREGMIINFVDPIPFMEATRAVYDTFVGSLVSHEAYNAVRNFLAGHR